MAPTPAPPSVIELLNLPTHPVLHHRLFLLIGKATSSSIPSFNASGPDGWIHVSINEDTNALFPSQKWEVNENWFKALVPLSSGENRIKLTHTTLEGRLLGEKTFQLAYQPVPNAKKVRLVVLCGKDSPLGRSPPKDLTVASEPIEQPALPQATHSPSAQQPLMPTPASPNRGITKLISKARAKLDANHTNGTPASADKQEEQDVGIDCPPGWRREKLKQYGDLAISRRIALQAYLWQAFHAEQMYRQGFGHRTFSLDERSEKEVTEFTDLPRVEWVRCKYTMRQIRDPEWAQQKHDAKDSGKLHTIASEAVQDKPFCQPGDACAVTIGDAQWDPKMKLLRGHAALGAFAGIDDKPSVGIMGSHWLWAAPQSLSEVTETFMDSEPTDERYCVNDVGQGKTVALTVNIGSGALLHETGHALSNPHYPHGFMARGYMEFNRAFMTRETHSLTGTQGPLKPITPENDAGMFDIHRCQAIRATLHPAFAHPNDRPPVHYSTDPIHWASVEPMWKPTKKGTVVSSSAGISFIEIEAGGKFKDHIEWAGKALGKEDTPPLSTLITPETISLKVGFDVLLPTSPEVKLTAVGCNLHSTELTSFRRQAIATSISVPGVDMAAFGREVRNGIVTKTDDDEDHSHWMILFKSAWKNGPSMVEIDIFSGAALDGLLFHYSDGSSQSIGRVHAASKPCAKLYLGVKDRFERIEVRSGWWIDAARIVLSSGEGSKFCGGAGGSLRILGPSDEEEVVGIVASAGDWVDSLGVLVADRRM